LLLKKNRIPFFFERTTYDEFINLRQNNFYSAFLKGTAWSTFIFPEFKTDLTIEEHAKHMKKYKKERDINLKLKFTKKKNINIIV
jgi:hypothetical protein